MDELAAKWEDLTDIQQASITELIAGKRQGNIVSSLMSNFDTAREALETSLNSSGSAMREHEKWQQSLEAQINKLKASWQGLSQAFMKSDFLKSTLNDIIALVDGITKLIDTLGVLPALLGVFAGLKGFPAIFKKVSGTISELGGVGALNLKSFKDVWALLLLSFPKVEAGILKLSAAFKGLKSSGNGAADVMSVFKKALSSGNIYIAAAVIAITALTAAIVYKKKKAEELAKEVEELTSKYQEEHKALKDIEGDFDTSNEDSMISKYEKLSKGVDNLGRNVSLTADEYSEYQSIVNSIAEQFPSLVSGYDEQGNALLSCKGNVEELTKAYQTLIHEQNRAILTNTKDIEDNFENIVSDKESSVWDFWEMSSNTIKDLEKIYNGDNSLEEISEILGEGTGENKKWQIAKVLEDAGVDVSWLGYSRASNEVNKLLEETMKTDPSKIKGIIDDYYSQFEEVVEQEKAIAQAKLSEAFDVSSAISGLNYANISEDLQSVAHQAVNSLDLDFLAELQESGKTVEQWTTEMLDQLNAISKEDNTKIESAFDLQTQFNGGDISYGEYVKGLENTGKLIDSLNLKDEIKTQLKLSLGLDEDGLVEGYKVLKNKLANNEKFNIMPSEYESLLDSLSSEEVSVLVGIIPELEKTDYKETIADVKAALEKEMMLQGLTFDLNLEVEAAGLEALNTALAESVSATGLSSESITALKGRYADLESQGYDLSSMFEETSTGIRLNRQEFNKLENAYATEKLAEVDGELEEMKIAYDDLGEAIKNCDDPVRKSELFNERQTLAKRISEAATLAHQYKGLTNAYNDWLSAEEAGQERDMYENVIKGFETVDDEISRGWIDDGTIEFLELLSGRTDLAGKSGKELKKVYDSLDKSIGNAGYSVRDFFTVNEDGESTNTGVYNFLETIESLGGKYKDAIKQDDNGNIIGFNFEVAGGDEAIAEALGVSEELVQIMVRAADDAGFVVSMDGTYRQLADLQNEAKAAADYLHEIGKTDFQFDFNTTSVENLKTQLEEAHKILDDKKFWNKDGTFNFNADGATQAMQVVSTLQAKLDKLTEDKYGIGLTVEDEEFEEPLENLQEYGRTVQTLNQLKLNPKANAEEIEELNGELNKISEYFANLDKDTKVELGFEADDGIEEVKKKIESGEIEIPTVLDIQTNMDKNLETLADLALLNSGLLSENEEETIEKKYQVDVEVETGEVDTTDVEEKVDNAIIDGLGNPILSREANIEIIAETFGIKDVDNLSSKLEGLDDKTIQAIAEAIGQGDVDALQIAIDGMDGNVVQAVAEALGYSDVETLKVAVRNMKGNEVDAKVNTDGQKKKIDTFQSWIDNIKGKTVDIVINTFKNVIETVSSGGKKKAAQRTGSDPDGKGSNVNGTANVNGTIGRAFKQGSWGTKNSGTALVGELGREVLIRDGRYFTVGDYGAEFIKYQRGDIILNHVQSDELFKNGKVTSGGGRAKALVGGTALTDGTAFSKGTGGIGKVVHVVTVDGTSGKTKTTTKTTTTKNTVSDTKTTSGSSGSGGVGKVGSNSSKVSSNTNQTSGGSSGSTDKDFEEVIDWIEVIIDRIERSINKFDQQANNIYKSWSSRNTALMNQISEVNKEITLQQQAKSKYISAANDVGLSESWAKKVRNGEINIDTIKDETLAEKIKSYQDYYNKALNCEDAIRKLREEESKLYAQRFKNIQTQYDGILQGYEHTETMLNEYITQAEEQGYIVSRKYYAALISNEKQNIAQLKKEQSALIAERDKAVADGKIKKGSEAWYEQCAAIDEVTQSIESSSTALLEYARAIEEINWSVFDLIQERISDITAESEFLIELMSNDNLFDDKGKLTEQGASTLGLHALNYNTGMYQADEYGAEIAKLDKQIAKDPYDQELINRRRELVELQRESILAAEDEKIAIRDLVEEGINLELDALQELIDKKNEELESEKDLYEYSKKVSEQTENIANIQKQLSAYSSDNSEEAKAKIQELKVSLEEAETELQETEWDRYIDQQSQLLDTLYTDYETILNSRMDNIDFLLQQVIDGINATAGEGGTLTSALGAEGAIAQAIVSAIGENGSVKNILNAEATKVGTTLSSTMNSIWSVGDGNAKSILTTYGTDFQSKLTTTNAVLNSIKVDISRMVDDVDKDAQKKVTANKTATSAKKDPTKTTTTKKSSTTTKKNTTKKSSGDGKAKVGDKVKFVSGQYYYDSQGKKPLGSHNLGKQVYITSINTKDWATHPYHISTGNKLGKGDLGWLKLNQLSGYASGKKRISNGQYAWTQENGQEYIIRPSDGAILTPVAKGDSILNATASGNIWSMANNPAEFIKDNLGLDNANVPNGANVNNVYSQTIENVTFSMPNVHSYNEMLMQMQKDPKFDKLIKAMTIDQIAGKSSLAKNKSIR